MCKRVPIISSWIFSLIGNVTSPIWSGPLCFSFSSSWACVGWQGVGYNYIRTHTTGIHYCPHLQDGIFPGLTAINTSKYPTHLYAVKFRMKGYGSGWTTWMLPLYPVSGSRRASRVSGHSYNHVNGNDEIIKVMQFRGLSAFRFMAYNIKRSRSSRTEEGSSLYYYHKVTISISVYQVTGLLIVHHEREQRCQWQWTDLGERGDIANCLWKALEEIRADSFRPSR